jgi:FixJ family two-component response regulator
LADGLLFALIVETHWAQFWPRKTVQKEACSVSPLQASKNGFLLSPSNSDRPTIFLIDDDQAVREALQGLFCSVGLQVEMFASAQAYLAAGISSERPGCMVLDVRMPGQSGLDFQKRLDEYDIRRPVIFISGHADIAMAVRAMKAGAIEFLTKPVREQDLLDAVAVAMEKDLQRRLDGNELSQVKIRYETLTAREREIMACVVTGRRNKQIAADMGLTEATVKLHRGHIMQKMGAQSIVELLRMADLLDIGDAAC